MVGRPIALNWLFIALIALAGCAPFPTAVIIQSPDPAPATLPSPPPVTLAATAAFPSPTVTSTRPVPTALHTSSPIASPTIQTTWRFALIGDYGIAGEAAAQVAAMVHSWEPDLILTLGDNNYPLGGLDTLDANVGQYYSDYIYPYLGLYGPGGVENRFFSILGNHDLYTEMGQPYFDYFTLPNNERYYDFTWGPAHFFALNSDPSEPDGVGRSSVQAAWLHERMSASTAPWQVVMMHVPPYSSGPLGAVDWMRWPFADWGADILFAGHDHLYERLEVDGLPLVINGLGGGGIYAFGSTDPRSKVRFNANHGALLVTASSETMWIEFYSLGGEKVDQLVLRQGAGK